MVMYKGSITDLKGIQVGCAQNEQGRTGCTVVLFDGCAVAGVDVRGGGPGTVETDALNPLAGVQRIDAISLAGGSAMGLAAADGVRKWMREKGRGFKTPYGRIPIVPGAIIYDLGFGSNEVFPDAKMGYQACTAAGQKVAQGSFGAGTGATVGKLLGMECAQKSGQGTSSLVFDNGLIVAAIVVVNALGDIYDQGKKIAGLQLEDGSAPETLACMLEGVGNVPQGANTTIGVIATNAMLTKAQATKMAAVGHDGYAIAIRPVHTMLDGDTVFGVSTCEIEADFNVVLAGAAQVMAQAIANAVYSVKEQEAKRDA